MKVKQVLKNAAYRFKDKPAVVFKERRVSFGKLLEIVEKLSSSLLSLGLSKGDKVAVFLPNGLEYIYAYLSVFSSGAVVVPLDARLNQEEIISTLTHCEAKCLITSSFRNISLSNIEKQIPSLETIILCDEGISQDIAGVNLILLNKLLEQSTPKIEEVSIDDTDPCAIFYTSGTTAKPKGVLWNYHHLDAAPEAMEHFVDLSERDVKLCCLPLSHMGGLVYLQNCIVYGITLVLMEHFIPQLFLENIKRYKVTCMHLVPTIFTAILGAKEFETTDLSTLRWVVVFGAPNNPVMLRRFNQYCPKAHLINGYGLTETAAPNVVSPFGRIDTVGKPAPSIEVAIFDENDLAVPTNEVGEIVMRGWPVMVGYFKEPELTKEVIKNGWFHTGDLGRINEEGFLYIVGRKKDMIKVGGLVVYPVEIEHVLSRYPGVLEVVVVGITDELRGEKVKACLVVDNKANIASDDITSFCRKHLASFKVPHLVEFRESLPKTSSGKIQKELLK